MVQIIRRTPQISAHELVGETASNAAKSFAAYFSSKEQKQQLQQENEHIKNNFGVDLSNVVDPDERKIILGQMLKQGAPAAAETPLQKAQRLKYEQQAASAKASQKRVGQILGETDPQEALEMQGESPQGQSAEQSPQPGQQQRKKIEDYSDEDLGHLAAFKTDPDPNNKYIANIAEQEQQRRLQKQKLEREESKSAEKKAAELRKEILPYINELASKAEVAQSSIENKERSIELIKKGDLDDPTYAALVQALPFNLGERMLSDDTVVYRAGLIDDFGDLKNIFKGATRVKEVEIFEKKIPDIYLTDSQKEAILKSRINSLRADVIKADAAAEIEAEGKPMSLLAFRKEVGKRSKEKMEALANKSIDDIKSVIQDAENRKKIPLDPNDPEDKQIAEQIMKEAGGDRKKARELAKKKGYTF